MALNSYRLLLKLMIIAALAAALPVVRVRADSTAPPAPAPALPSLQSFARLVANGQADELRGVYVPGLFAHPVVQQPSGDPGYISPQDNLLTEFGIAPQLGSTGVLAHNYLAGRDFSQLQPGQLVQLVFGDGRTAAYTVTIRLRYQALQPNSAYSAFVNLATGTELGASELFTDVYGRPGALILQTCIAAEGISTWGRLFVVAEPHLEQSLTPRTGTPPL